MPEIGIKIRNKLADAVGTPVIVCGNSDYTLNFDLDAEWAPYDLKTLRVVYCKKGRMLRAPDVVFQGDTVALPALYGISEVEIGLYAGDIITTAPARIPCIPCITDEDPQHGEPTPDVYAQILDIISGMESGGAGAGITTPILFGAVGTGGVSEIEEEL